MLSRIRLGSLGLRHLRHQSHRVPRDALVLSTAKLARSALCQPAASPLALGLNQTRRLSAVAQETVELPPSSTTVWHSAHNTVTISFEDGAKTSFDAIWLRDHCRCPNCFHPVTKQRLLDTSQIPLDIKPNRITITNGGKNLAIAWSAGQHESMYDIDWLRRHAYNPPVDRTRSAERAKRLWDSSLAEALPTVPYAEVMHSEEGLGKWLENIDTFGIGFVDGVPPTPEATEKLARRIAFIRESHYGTFWDFTPNMEHADTAYTALALPAHTDTTYFTDPVGLQMFHLLSHTGTGGKSLFVDGFNVAKQLKLQHPESFDILTKFKISAQCAGDEDTHIIPAVPFPILELDPASEDPGQLLRIRFNNDDRTTLQPSAQLSITVPQFYEALRNFTRLLRKPENELWLSLKPGQAVIFDNWRVLHGRSEFTGQRRMVGCYVNWDDYRSRVRTVVDKK